MNAGIGSLPFHQYVLVDSRFTHENPDPINPFVPAIWFGLRAKLGEMWGCQVLFESGAWYRVIPPHALAFDMGGDSRPEYPWGPKDAQMWDCYGIYWSAHAYTLLSKLRCKAMIRPAKGFVDAKILWGDYLFTVAPLNDGFSESPDQAKEFCFIRLDNGRLTIQPTNRVVFEDRSFTTGEPVPKLKLQTETWSCED